MSTASVTPTASWTSESPRRFLVDFLARESPRYVPFPYHHCDAIFTHHWFKRHLFSPARIAMIEPRQRLFEMMRPEFKFATVLGIRHVLLNKDTTHQNGFRLRWSAMDEEYSEIFLISCYGLPDHAAVVPTSYLRRRYGSTRNIEGLYETDQTCPTLLAPFMVHHRDILMFLDRIYRHASKSAASDLMNPTYHATYHGWRPELHNFKDVLPMDSFGEKLHRMQCLYIASKILKAILTLSRKGEGGHFSLNGNGVEYWRKAWSSHGPVIRVTLKRQLTTKLPWKFLLLEDYFAKQAICLPRGLVPKPLIGPGRHGGDRNSASWPHVEVEARLWARFTFSMLTPLHVLTVLISIMSNYSREAECDLGLGHRERDARCESSTPAGRLSGLEGWILEQLHRDQ